MTKTLLVTYTPRIGSTTAQLVEAFRVAAEGKTEITHVDLSVKAPRLFDAENLNAYVKRYYMGQDLTDAEQASLIDLTEAVAQVKAADRIVIAFPLYNFSVPAAVKAWIDAVTVAGVTFRMTDHGYEGLCAGTTALILTTSGAAYDTPPMSAMDHGAPFVQAVFGFMGITSDVIRAQGTNAPGGEERIAAAAEAVKTFTAQWL